MKVSKQIMNPVRIKQLRIIAEKGEELNDVFLANKSHVRLEQAQLSIKRFGELKLIQFTGGGFFILADKGKQYLEELS